MWDPRLVLDPVWPRLIHSREYGHLSNPMLSSRHSSCWVHLISWHADCLSVCCLQNAQFCTLWGPTHGLNVICRRQCSQLSLQAMTQQLLG